MKFCFFIAITFFIFLPFLADFGVNCEFDICVPLVGSYAPTNAYLPSEEECSFVDIFTVNASSSFKLLIPFSIYGTSFPVSSWYYGIQDIAPFSATLDFTVTLAGNLFDHLSTNVDIIVYQATNCESQIISINSCTFESELGSQTCPLLCGNVNCSAYTFRCPGPSFADFPVGDYSIEFSSSVSGTASVVGISNLDQTLTLSNGNAIPLHGYPFPEPVVNICPYGEYPLGSFSGPTCFQDELSCGNDKLALNYRGTNLTIINPASADTCPFIGYVRPVSVGPNGAPPPFFGLNIDYQTFSGGDDVYISNLYFQYASVHENVTLSVYYTTGCDFLTEYNNDRVSIFNQCQFTEVLLGATIYPDCVGLRVDSANVFHVTTPVFNVSCSFAEPLSSEEFTGFGILAKNSYASYWDIDVGVVFSDVYFEYYDKTNEIIGQETFNFSSCAPQNNMSVQTCDCGIDCDSFYASANVYSFVNQTGGQTDYVDGVATNAYLNNYTVGVVGMEPSLPYPVSGYQGFNVGGYIAVEAQCGVLYYITECTKAVQVWLYPNLVIEEVAHARTGFQSLTANGQLQCVLFLQDAFDQMTDGLFSYPVTDNFENLKTMTTPFGKAVEFQLIPEVYFDGNTTYTNYTQVYGFEIINMDSSIPFSGSYISCSTTVDRQHVSQQLFAPQENTPSSNRYFCRSGVNESMPSSPVPGVQRSNVSLFNMTAGEGGGFIQSFIGSNCSTTDMCGPNSPVWITPAATYTNTIAGVGIVFPNIPAMTPDTLGQVFMSVSLAEFANLPGFQPNMIYDAYNTNLYLSVVNYQRIEAILFYVSSADDPFGFQFCSSRAAPSFPTIPVIIGAGVAFPTSELAQTPLISFAFRDFISGCATEVTNQSIIGIAFELAPGSYPLNAILDKVMVTGIGLSQSLVVQQTSNSINHISVNYVPSPNCKMNTQTCGAGHPLKAYRPWTTLTEYTGIAQSGNCPFFQTINVDSVRFLSTKSGAFAVSARDLDMQYGDLVTRIGFTGIEDITGAARFQFMVFKECGNEFITDFLDLTTYGSCTPFGSFPIDLAFYTLDVSPLILGDVPRYDGHSELFYGVNIYYQNSAFVSFTFGDLYFEVVNANHPTRFVTVNAPCTGSMQQAPCACRTCNNAPQGIEVLPLIDASNTFHCNTTENGGLSNYPATYIEPQLVKGAPTIQGDIEVFDGFQPLYSFLNRSETLFPNKASSGTIPHDYAMATAAQNMGCGVLLNFNNCSGTMQVWIIPDATVYSLFQPYISCNLVRDTARVEQYYTTLFSVPYYLNGAHFYYAEDYYLDGVSDISFIYEDIGGNYYAATSFFGIETPMWQNAPSNGVYLACTVGSFEALFGSRSYCETTSSGTIVATTNIAGFNNPFYQHNATDCYTRQLIIRAATPCNQINLCEADGFSVQESANPVALSFDERGYSWAFTRPQFGSDPIGEQFLMAVELEFSSLSMQTFWNSAAALLLQPNTDFYVTIFLQLPLISDLGIVDFSGNISTVCHYLPGPEFENFDGFPDFPPSVSHSSAAFENRPIPGQGMRVALVMNFTEAYKLLSAALIPPEYLRFQMEISYMFETDAIVYLGNVLYLQGIEFTVVDNVVGPFYPLASVTAQASPTCTPGSEVYCESESRSESQTPVVSAAPSHTPTATRSQSPSVSQSPVVPTLFCNDSSIDVIAYYRGTHAYQPEGLGSCPYNIILSNPTNEYESQRGLGIKIDSDGTNSTFFFAAAGFSIEFCTGVPFSRGIYTLGLSVSDICGQDAYYDIYSSSFTQLVISQVPVPENCTYFATPFCYSVSAQVTGNYINTVNYKEGYVSILLFVKDVGVATNTDVAVKNATLSFDLYDDGVLVAGGINLFESPRCQGSYRQETCNCSSCVNDFFPDNEFNYQIAADIEVTQQLRCGMLDLSRGRPSNPPLVVQLPDYYPNTSYIENTYSAYPYDGPYFNDSSLTTGGQIALDMNCGVLVYVPPCYRSLQVWLNPVRAESVLPLAMQCSVTINFYNHTIPVIILGGKNVSVVYTPSGIIHSLQSQVNITFPATVKGPFYVFNSRIYGFEIPYNGDDSPIEGYYISCTLVSDSINLFEGRNYCMMNSTANATEPVAVMGDIDLFTNTSFQQGTYCYERVLTVRASPQCPQLEFCNSDGITLPLANYSFDYFGPLLSYPALPLPAPFPNSFPINLFVDFNNSAVLDIVDSAFDGPNLLEDIYFQFYIKGSKYAYTLSPVYDIHLQSRCGFMPFNCSLSLVPKMSYIIGSFGTGYVLNYAGDEMFYSQETANLTKCLQSYAALGGFVQNLYLNGTVTYLSSHNGEESVNARIYFSSFAIRTYPFGITSLSGYSDELVYRASSSNCNYTDPIDTTCTHPQTNTQSQSQSRSQLHSNSQSHSHSHSETHSQSQSQSQSHPHSPSHSHSHSQSVPANISSCYTKPLQSLLTNMTGLIDDTCRDLTLFSPYPTYSSGSIMVVNFNDYNVTYPPSRGHNNITTIVATMTRNASRDGDALGAEVIISTHNCLFTYITSNVTITNTSAAVSRKNCSDLTYDTIYTVTINFSQLSHVPVEDYYSLWIAFGTKVAGHYLEYPLYLFNVSVNTNYHNYSAVSTDSLCDGSYSSFECANTQSESPTMMRTQSESSRLSTESESPMRSESESVPLIMPCRHSAIESVFTNMYGSTFTGCSNVTVTVVEPQPFGSNTMTISIADLNITWPSFAGGNNITSVEIFMTTDGTDFEVNLELDIFQMSASSCYINNNLYNQLSVSSVHTPNVTLCPAFNPLIFKILFAFPANVTYEAGFEQLTIIAGLNGLVATNITTYYINATVYTSYGAYEIINQNAPCRGHYLEFACGEPTISPSKTETESRIPTPSHTYSQALYCAGRPPRATGSLAFGYNTSLIGQNIPQCRYLTEFIPTEGVQSNMALNFADYNITYPPRAGRNNLTSLTATFVSNVSYTAIANFTSMIYLGESNCSVTNISEYLQIHVTSVEQALVACSTVYYYNKTFTATIDLSNISLTVPVNSQYSSLYFSLAGTAAGDPQLQLLDVTLNTSYHSYDIIDVNKQCAGNYSLEHCALPTESYSHTASHSQSFTHTQLTSPSPTHSYSPTSSERQYTTCCTRDVPMYVTPVMDASVPYCGMPNHHREYTSNNSLHTCSNLEYPIQIYTGGVYQLKDFIVQDNDRYSAVWYSKNFTNMGIKIGYVNLAFSARESNVRMTYSPGRGLVSIYGTVYPEVSDGNCVFELPPALATQPWIVNITLTAGLNSVPYLTRQPWSTGGTPFFVVETDPAHGNRSMPVFRSKYNRGVIYPDGYPQFNITFGLQSISPTILSNITNAAIDDLYDAEMIITSAYYVRQNDGPQWVGISEFQMDTNCSAYVNSTTQQPLLPAPNATTNTYEYLQWLGCQNFQGSTPASSYWPKTAGAGWMLFGIEALCNGPNPQTPGIGQGSNSASQSRTHSSSISYSGTPNIHPLPPPNISNYNITKQPRVCTPIDSAGHGEVPGFMVQFSSSGTVCGIFDQATAPPLTVTSDDVFYGSSNLTLNPWDLGLFLDYYAAFNSSVIGGRSGFVQFDLFTNVGRVAIFIKLQWYTGSNSTQLPGNFVTLVGTSPETASACGIPGAAVVACIIPFPSYTSPLFIGYKTVPRYILPFNVQLRGLVVSPITWSPTVQTSYCVIAPNITFGSFADGACRSGGGGSNPSDGTYSYNEHVLVDGLDIVFTSGRGS